MHEVLFGECLGSPVVMQLCEVVKVHLIDTKAPAMLPRPSSYGGCK